MIAIDAEIMLLCDNGSDEEDSSISNNNQNWDVLGETCRLENVQSMQCNPKLSAW